MKCPKDNRERPVYITIDNKRVLAISDGKGNAYKTYGEGYAVFDSKISPENLIAPETYEFERGLSGMDF